MKIFGLPESVPQVESLSPDAYVHIVAFFVQALN